MTIKDLSRKQIIIPMGINNTEREIVKSNANIANINKLLKSIKSEVSVDFIYSNIKDIVVMTSKIATMSDLNIIEEYMKYLNNVNLSDVISPRLLQSKSYLKILGIPYCVENTNLSITTDIVKRII